MTVSILRVVVRVLRVGVAGYFRDTQRVSFCPIFRANIAELYTP
ncbi:hypothetical protein M2118_000483 [Aurantimicrobium minutum]|nr:hypothetical protein [Aurantimicrobium minutum]